jgi:CheY-like chemotaxis protein
MILLVEDDELVRGVVRDTLEAEGWDVTVCKNGEAALAEVEGEGRYDLIITDYQLPGADGVELARAVRGLKHRRGTPIIMFSASHVEAHARAAGVNLFLRKPEDIGRLADSVSRHLDGG